jgi:hypothetical protein
MIELNKIVIIDPNNPNIEADLTTTGAITAQNVIVRSSTGSIVDFSATSSTNSTNLEGKGKIAVSTTPVELVFTGQTKVIFITADINNTGVIYVGKSNITSTGANSLTYLEAGDSLGLEYDDTINAIFIVASVANQNCWAGSLVI